MRDIVTSVRQGNALARNAQISLRRQLALQRILWYHYVTKCESGVPDVLNRRPRGIAANHISQF